MARFAFFIQHPKILNLHFKKEYLTHLNMEMAYEHEDKQSFGFGATKKPGTICRAYLCLWLMLLQY